MDSITILEKRVPFVYFQAVGPTFQEQIIKNASSTTLPILNKGKFSQLPFSVCSTTEQKEVVRLIEERLSRCEHLFSEIDEQLLRASALRQSILKQAFSGQLVAQGPSDEPASVLLDRIRREREAGRRNSATTKPARKPGRKPEKPLPPDAR